MAFRGRAIWLPVLSFLCLSAPATPAREGKADPAPARTGVSIGPHCWIADNQLVAVDESGRLELLTLSPEGKVETKRFEIDKQPPARELTGLCLRDHLYFQGDRYQDVFLYEMKRGAKVSLLYKHSDPIIGISNVVDKSCCLVSLANEIGSLNLSTGKYTEVARLPVQGKRGQPTSIALSKDGRIAITSLHAPECADFTVYWTDVVTHKIVAEYRGNCEYVFAVAANPKKPQFAVPLNRDSIDIFDLSDTIKPTSSLKIPSEVYRLSYSGNGEVLAAACCGAEILIWSGTNAPVKLSAFAEGDYTMKSISLSPSGQWLAIQVYKKESLLFIYSIKTDKWVSAAK